jgi:hypothetical protein
LELLELSFEEWKMNWFRQRVTRRQIYDDLHEEIKQHLAEQVEALVAEGMSRREAEQAARRALNIDPARLLREWRAAQSPPRGPCIKMEVQRTLT